MTTTKYAVIRKPSTKHRPAFTADTLEEISAWLDANAAWTHSGSDGTFQKRTINYSDISVFTAGLRHDGSGEHIISAWVEASEAYSLIHRTRPVTAA